MSILSAIKSIFSKKQGVKKSTQQQRNQQAEVSSVSTVPTSSKDGANFEYRSGIRYQNEENVAYVLPNDYNELDRLHQQHWMFRYVLQCNFHAPVEDELRSGINVLDSGCGPGTWTLEMSEAYRESKFYGMDCSAIFPDNIKPPNVEFTVGNLAKSLPYENDFFGYIYQRLVFLGLTNEDWNNALEEFYRILKPGGFVELIEPDMKNVDNLGPKTSDLHTKLLQMMAFAKTVPEVALELHERLTKAGFVNIKVKKVTMKLNHTDKGGKLFWDDYRSGYSNNRPMMAKMNAEWEDEQVYENYLNDAGIECAANKTSGTIYVYVAQKPKN